MRRISEQQIEISYPEKDRGEGTACADKSNKQTTIGVGETSLRTYGIQRKRKLLLKGSEQDEIVLQNLHSFSVLLCQSRVW